MTFFPSTDVMKMSKEEFKELPVQSSQPYKSDHSEVLTFNIAQGMMTNTKCVMHAEGSIRETP